jgi:hypothetical protein
MELFTLYRRADETRKLAVALERSAGNAGPDGARARLGEALALYRGVLADPGSAQRVQLALAGLGVELDDEDPTRLAGALAAEAQVRAAAGESLGERGRALVDRLRNAAQGGKASELLADNLVVAAAAEREDALALARFHLRRGGPVVDPDLARSPETRILALRSGYLNGTREPEEAPLAQEALAEEEGGMAAVLTVEFLLDRRVLEGPDFDGAAELQRRLSLLAERDIGDDPGALLLLACLSRAQAYGWIEDSHLTDRAVELAGSPRGPLAERLLASSLSRPGSPLDTAWIEALRLEVGEVLAADPVGQAWAAWQPDGR